MKSAFDLDGAAQLPPDRDRHFFGAILLVLRRTGRNAMQIVVLIGINFAIGLFFPGIAWQAHLGGLVVGVVLGLAYAYAPRDRRTLVSVGSTVVVALALVATAYLTYRSVALPVGLVG